MKLHSQFAAFHSPVPLFHLRSRRCTRRPLHFQTPAAACVSSALSQRVTDFLSKVQEGNPLEGLRRADALWERMRKGSPGREQERENGVVVVEKKGTMGTDDAGEGLYDACVCGGTLGIFLACVLQMKGFKVIVVERGKLLGRKQEWNISRDELDVFLELGVLGTEELEQVVSSEWNPSRVGLRGSSGSRELWVKDVLNLGVSPELLIEIVKRKFLDAGGVVEEFKNFDGAEIFADGVKVKISSNKLDAVTGPLGAGGGGLLDRREEGWKSVIKARLLIDAMGSFSPIVRQLRGRNTSPDGVCITVGTCAKGPWPNNATADVLYSFTPTDFEKSIQYFWEAFPASGNRRTTYMFAYLDCDERRPSIGDVFDDYLALLPEYQGVAVDDLDVSRALFGFFPCYRDSPLKTSFDRVIQIGDAGGLQSPISFGGFGALTRHLDRLSRCLADALSDKSDSLLSKPSLREIQPYMPSLSTTWLFQRAMSVRPDSRGQEYFINDLLWENMSTMKSLGDSVMRPFLQDVVQAGPLTKTLLAMTISNFVFSVKLFGFIGPAEILGWLGHYMYLVVYSALSRFGSRIEPALLQTPFLNEKQKFTVRRKIEAWTFGSGRDYKAFSSAVGKSMKTRVPV